MPVVGWRRKKAHRGALVANADESRSHVVGESELYKEEEDVLVEMWKIGGRDMGEVWYAR